LIKSEADFVVRVSYTKTATADFLQNYLKSLRTLKAHFQNTSPWV